MWLFCFPNQRMLMWAQGRARWACGHRAVAGRAGRAGRVSMRQAGLEQAGHRQGRLGAGMGSGELRWVQVGASGGLRVLRWAAGRQGRLGAGHRARAGRAGRAGSRLQGAARQAWSRQGTGGQAGFQGARQAWSRQGTGRLGSEAGRGSGELRWVQVSASGGLRLAQVGSGGPRAGRAGLEQGTGPWQAGQGRAGRAVAAGFKAPGRLGAGRAQAGRQGWPSRGVDVKSSRTFGANSGATRKHSLHASHRVLNSSWRRPAKFSGLRHTPPLCPRKHSAR